MVKIKRVKGEQLKEMFVGISALKASLKQSVESLQAGEVDHIIILRNNKAVGVMVSFEDYQSMKIAVEQYPTLTAEEREIEKMRIEDALREESRVLRGKPSDA